MDGLNSYAIGQHTYPQSWSGLINKVQPFLGLPPRDALPMNAYERIPKTNVDLPDVYRGQNLYLRDTIDNLILYDIDWYFSICLPWAYTEQNSIQYNKWEFDHCLADRVPHEGISRLVTSHRSTFYGSIVRRGLAFKLEVDFYNTDEGILMWYRNCKGISSCVLETQAYDTINELLACKDNDKKWNEIFTHMQISHLSIIQDEIDKYACVQKDANKIFIVFREYERIMKNNGGSAPDMLIIPPQSRMYLQLVGEHKTEFYMVGQEGPDLRRKGPNAVGLFDNSVQVFETRDFDVYGSGPRLQLLTRAISVGERYTMTLADYRGLSSFRGYETRWRDIYIYDENKDDWAKVRFADAFMNARIFNDNGQPTDRMKEYIRRAQEEDKKPMDPYKNNGIYPPSNDDEPMDPNKDKHNDELYFPLFTRGKDGKIEWATYLGQINLRAATSHDFRRMAESVLGRIQLQDGGAADTQDYRTLINLVRSIENQSYDRQYWLDLISSNIGASLNDAGTFTGETIPSDVRDHWDILDAQPEWVPNVHGGLNLPTPADKDVTYRCTHPAGFANVPGIRTLAAELHCQDSPWRGIAKEAYIAIEFLDRMVNAVRGALPSSELVNAKNRAPWFHREDATSTFFQLIASRDPLFLPALKASSGQNTRGIARPHDNAIPFRVSKAFSGDESTSTVVDEEVPVEGSPETKVKVTFYKAAIAKGIPRMFAIGVYLGTETWNKYSDITAMADLSSEAKNALDDALLRLIFTKGSGRKMAALIIYNLHALPSNSQRVTKINALIPTGKSASSVKKALAELTDDSDFGGTVVVPNITTRKGGLTEELKSENFRISPEFNDLLKAVVAARTDLSEALELDLTDTSAIEKSTETAPAFIALKAALAAFKATQIGKNMTTKPDAADALPSELSNDRPIASLKIDATPDTVSTAEFYRTPLTSSYVLLTSIASQTVPLVLPSDPLTGHTHPYKFNAHGGASFIDPTIYQRPQYAHIDELHKKGSKFIDASVFGAVARHTKVDRNRRTPTVASGKLIGANARGSKRSAKIFVDDDDDVFDDPFTLETEEEMRRSGHETTFNKSWPLRDLETKGARKDEKHVPFDDSIYGELSSEVYNPIFVARHKQLYEDISDDVTRLVAICCMWMKNDGLEWLRAINNNVCVPINLLLWRPNITHEMSTYIMMKSGAETGANFWGHTNFMVSSDGATKMILGNFTFNSKALVYNERNVRLLENVKAERYRGGNNTKFMVARDLLSESIDRGSIIVTAIPVTEEDFTFCTSFTGRWPHSSYNQEIDGVETKPHYSTYHYYDRMVWKVHEKITSGEIGQERFFDGAAFAGRVNHAAMQGTQATFNVSTRMYDKWTLCKGHRGRNGSYPGAAEVWNGKYSYLKEVSFSDFRLE
jgi:hypothetical protein